MSKALVMFKEQRNVGPTDEQTYEVLTGLCFVAAPIGTILVAIQPCPDG
jgi:hypothetical protein